MGYGFAAAVTAPINLFNNVEVFARGVVVICRAEKVEGCGPDRVIGLGGAENSCRDFFGYECDCMCMCVCESVSVCVWVCV